MRVYTFLVFFIYSQAGFTQISYTSPLTQHFPTGEIETIDRTITITEKEIVIESETPVNSIHKQTFVINQSAEKEFPEHGLSQFYVTRSKDNIYTTYFLIPITDKVELIEVIQPQQLSNPAKHWRFLIN